MLDTVSFSLHNCNAIRGRKPDEPEHEYQINPYVSLSNHRLYLALKENENTYVERYVHIQHHEVIENVRPVDFFQKKVVKKSLVFAPKVRIMSKNENVEYYQNTRGKYNIPSYDYNLIYDIKSNQDEIEFSLSIPKYLYGYSLAQFLPNINTPRFMSNPSMMSDVGFQSELIVERLQEFIRVLLKDISLTFGFSFDLDIMDIQINYVDLCYNQFYHSKKQCLARLDAQKKMFKKRVRSDSPMAKPYDTGLSYRNSKRTFYFKIYHKGSEFMQDKGRTKSDFKRLMSLNEEYWHDNYTDLYSELSLLSKYLDVSVNEVQVEAYFSYYKTFLINDINHRFCHEFEKLMPYKVFFLKQESDKVLRYEMRFASNYMSSIYKRKVYCSGSVEYQKMLKTFHKVQQYYDHLNKGNVNKAKDFKRKWNLTLESFREYEAVKNHISKVNKFFLKNTSEVVRYEHSFSKVMDLYKDRNSQRWRISSEVKATFSKELFKELVSIFMDEVLYYQTKTVKEPLTILDKVDKYNLEVPNRKRIYEDVHGKAALAKKTRNQKMKLGLIEFNRSRIEVYLREMDNGMSLQEIREKYNLKKSAYYDLRSILKMFSLGDETIKAEYDFKDIRTDFLDYYRRLSNVEFSRNLFSPYYTASVRSDSYQFKNSFQNTHFW